MRQMQKIPPSISNQNSLNEETSSKATASHYRNNTLIITNRLERAHRRVLVTHRYFVHQHLMQKHDSKRFDDISDSVIQLKELSSPSTSCCQHKVLFVKDDLIHNSVSGDQSLRLEEDSCIEAEPINQISRRIVQNISFVTGANELDDILTYKNEKVLQDSVVFVHSPNKEPASPCSPITQLELPCKEEEAFLSVHPGFTTTKEVGMVAQCLKKALHVLNGHITKSGPWNLSVLCLCAAESVQFGINFFQIKSTEKMCSVEFVQEIGDESKFVCISDWLLDNWEYFASESWATVDDVMNLPFEWTQSRESRKFAISVTEAKTLMKELNTDLHPETLYEITRELKDHCRHSGNRARFLEQDQSGFLKGIKWMLLDSDEIARFAVFILLQFAEDMDKDDNKELFQTTYMQNTYKLAVSSLAQNEDSAWTQDLARQLLASNLFRP